MCELLAYYGFSFLRLNLGCVMMQFQVFYDHSTNIQTFPLWKIDEITEYCSYMGLQT